MAGFEEFTNPRLVAVYDSWDLTRPDYSFYRDLAMTVSAEFVVDIGCGTGRLAVELARRGHRVAGVDPAPAMLAVARRRSGGNLVRWIEGDASCLGTAEYDLAVMSGHVVQVITDDRKLMATFAAIHRALRPGGRLAFDSRNPSARAWTRWTPDHSRRTLAGGVEVWLQDTQAHGDLVRSTIHYRFPNGEELVSHNELRFRSYGWLSQALTNTGFQIDPVDHDAPDLIFVASSAPARQPVVLRIYPSSSGDWLAAVLYDSSETVTVPLTGLDTTEVLQRLRDLGVPQELVLLELERCNLGWDLREEVRQRSEADMADWRRLDQERRERLKRDFRRRQKGE
ncbi:MAG TPA: class I SAM-dependent methyltransferase [Micromonosporaceae bacterium]|nr:class I SAM-dependent methyltransferase [Micromonosporaceae bacterium]